MPDTPKCQANSFGGHSKWFGKLARLMSAHFAPFCVANPHRYDFPYLNISLVIIASFLLLMETHTEMIMFCHNLIV